MLGLLLFWLWLRRQPVGTRSILVGSHQFILHPIFVAIAWRRVHGFWPRRIPVWFAFVLHDLGYWGLPNMQDNEGERHPEQGADMLSRLFDIDGAQGVWWRFSAGHSRFFAKIQRIDTSGLMRPDKFATVIVPLPLYLAMVYASGEVYEYVQFHADWHSRPEILNPTFRQVMTWATEIRQDWRDNYGPSA